MINHKEIDPYNEEVWDDEVIVKENDTIILDNVKINGNFEYNYQRSKYGQILPGRFDGQSEIAFNTIEEKNTFIQNFGEEFRNKIKNVCVEKLNEKIELYGVILSSINFTNNNITVRYDYWKKM